MAHAVNIKPDEMKDCLIVCQTMGEVDIPARLIKQSGLTGKHFYNNFDRLPFETVAFNRGRWDARRQEAAIKADAIRLFAYKHE